VRDVDQINTPPFEEPRPERERLFNAPWAIVGLPLLLVALYALQSTLLTDGVFDHWGLTPAALAQGRPQVLMTSLFLHGSWTHVLMNGAAILAFGSPAARLMGTDARGSIAFFAFYLACGVLAGLGFVAADLGDVAPVVGASGAASGLLGAASRLIEGRGRIGPMFGSTVLGMGLAWAIANVVLGVFGLTPGAAGMPVAWQAHLAGYLAGVLLIGPFARLAGRGADVFTQ
jgi:membrane associated rhomboid family serine protease